MARKPSMGRQKIEIKRINCKASHQVTFSKCRLGLFKMGSELSTLCGAATAILVFSPRGKIFSFGHRSVESIIERFLSDLPSETGALSLVDVEREAIVCELNQQYTEAQDQLEIEKKQANVLQQSAVEVKHGALWWEAPIDEMGLLEFQQLNKPMEDLREKMVKRAHELAVAKANVTSPFLSINSMGVVDRFGAAKPSPSPNNSSSIIPYGCGLSFGHGLF